VTGAEGNKLVDHEGVPLPPTTASLLSSFVREDGRGVGNVCCTVIVFLLRLVLGSERIFDFTEYMFCCTGEPRS
jgi:hypothetical protein